MCRSTCDEEYVGEAKTRSLKHSLSRRGARNRSDSPGDAMSPRENGRSGNFPSSIAKSRLATPFRDVLDGLSFLWRARDCSGRGTNAGHLRHRGHRVTLQWRRGVREVEIFGTPDESGDSSLGAFNPPSRFLRASGPPFLCVPSWPSSSEHIVWPVWERKCKLQAATASTEIFLTM